MGNQEYSYLKKRIGGIEKGCEWRLREIINKIEIIKHKISLINYIDIPPNHLSNNMLAIAESGANIHLEKQVTPKMAPVIMWNDTKAKILDGSTMKSSQIATLQIPGLRKQLRQIQIFPKIQTAPLI